MENQQGKPGAEAEALSLTKQAGKAVTVFSTIFVVAVIGMLAYHLHLMETKFPGVSLSVDAFEKCIKTCSEGEYRAMLEQDTMMQRNHRVRSAMSSRLLVNAVAEVIAITLIVIGGVLIFDRIESAQVQELSWKDRFSFKGTFPGVILCVLGTALALGTVYIAASKQSRFTVWDLPVYVADVNRTRTMMGNWAGTEPGSSPIREGEPIAQADSKEIVTTEEHLNDIPEIGK